MTHFGRFLQYYIQPLIVELTVNIVYPMYEFDCHLGILHLPMALVFDHHALLPHTYDISIQQSYFRT